MSDKFHSGHTSFSAGLIKLKASPDYRTSVKAILKKEGITGYKLGKNDGGDRYWYSIGLKKYFVRTWPMPKKNSLHVEYAIHRA